MDESFTIQISSNLVRRLVADDTKKLKKNTKRPKPKIPRETHPSLPTKKEAPEISDTRKSAAVPEIWPLQPPLFLPVPPPPHPAKSEIDGIRTVLQESERVVERLQKQEDQMVEEVTQKAKDLHDEEFKLPSPKPMPCLAEKDSCLDCYKENAGNPLKCAHLVQKFSDCARRARWQADSPPRGIAEVLG